MKLINNKPLKIGYKVDKIFKMHKIIHKLNKIKRK